MILLKKARPAFFVPVLSAFVVIPGAHAQAPDPQKAIAAQALYDQAVVELDEKSFASACRKLEEVTRLAPEGLGAKLTLGRCYEGEGRLASAWLQYALVNTLAQRSGQRERVERAAAKAAALKDRLALMTIGVAPEVRAIPGITITRDGVPVGEGQWGTPVPVDAGAHEIVATAPGYNPWRKSVEVVADGARVSVQVQAPVVDPDAKARADSPAAPPILVREVREAAPDRPWQRPVGIVAISAGAAVLVAGGVLGGLAIATLGESNRDHCNPSNFCDPEGLTLRKNAVQLGNASTATFVIGGVAATAGLILFATAPAPPKPAADGKTSGMAVELLPGGVRLRGAF